MTINKSWASVIGVMLACACTTAKASYLGCFVDPDTRIILSLDLGNKPWLPGTCVEECRNRGFVYAGVQNGGSCFCGNTLPRHKRYDPSQSVFTGGSQGCDQACTADSAQICGGVEGSSVYGTWIEHGCFVDHSARTLPLNLGNKPWLPDTCMVECSSRGHVFAGLQSHGFCFCGNTLPIEEIVDPSQDPLFDMGYRGCDRACTLDPTENCGGPYRNRVISLPPPPTSSPTASPTSSPIASPTSNPTTSPTASPTTRRQKMRMMMRMNKRKMKMMSMMTLHRRKQRALLVNNNNNPETKTQRRNLRRG